jgi:hypothetical protein
MTHDELLAKLSDYSCCSGTHEPALRAVVELHKPIEHDGKLICRECASLIDPWDENCYPCPTIQAIEKELM